MGQCGPWFAAANVSGLWILKSHDGEKLRLWALDSKSDSVAFSSSSSTHPWCPSQKLGSSWVSVALDLLLQMSVACESWKATMEKNCDFELLYILNNLPCKCQILSVANFVKVQPFHLYLSLSYCLNHPSALVFSFTLPFSTESSLNLFVWNWM